MCMHVSVSSLVPRQLRAKSYLGTTKLVSEHVQSVCVCVCVVDHEVLYNLIPHPLGYARLLSGVIYMVYVHNIDPDK